MVRVKHFLSIFAKNEQSNLVLVLVLVLESEGPYYHYLTINFIQSLIDFFDSLSFAPSMQLVTNELF